MGLFNWLGIGDEISKPIDSVSKLYTTDKERLEMQEKLESTLQKPQLAQLDINKTLAMSKELFNSGWIPMTGWTAGLLVLLFYAPQILLVTYVWGKGCLLTGVITPFPMKSDDILNLIGLMFGFGGYSLIKNKFNA